jgi:O-antigen/teichoic acid export membrane protein
LSSLKTITVRNVSYIGAAQFIVIVLTILTISVLARILTPEDFGIVGIGMIFVALFTSIQDFGVMQAIIRRDSRLEESISVGFGLRWIIATILAVIVIVFSKFIADFYGNPAITLVLIVMTLNLFIQPIAFSSLVLLTKRLNFSLIAIASIVQHIVLAIVSITLALLGFSYWSMVIGTLSGSASYVLVLRYYENAFFRPKMDIRLAKELMGFGIHLLVVGLMAFVIFNIDQLVIGKILGVVSLGIYYIAIKFGRALGEQISGTVNMVLFPTMVRFKDSIEQLKTAYMQSLRMIATMAVPLCLGISALSPVLVSVILGDGWQDAEAPIAILSFQGLLQALIPPAANVLLSIGKPKYMSMVATVQAIIIVAAVYPMTVLWGINGVCVLTTLLSLGVMICLLLIFSRIFKVVFVEMLRPLIPALASGFIMYLLLFLSVSIVAASPFWLVTLSVMGMGVYLVCLHVFSAGRDVRDFVGLVRSVLTRKKNLQ